MEWHSTDHFELPNIDITNNVTIDKLDVGMSMDGANEYLADIARLLTELQKEMGNLNEISNAINAGWTGKARDYFLEDLAKNVFHLQQIIKYEVDDLNYRFKELAEMYLEIDSDIAR